MLRSKTRNQNDRPKFVRGVNFMLFSFPSEQIVLIQYRTQTSTNIIMFSNTQMAKKHPGRARRHACVCFRIDRPKGGEGRPRGSKYSDEEKRHKAKEAALKHYNNNYEYCTLQQRLYKQRIRATKKESESN
jgi:hypothetical protein